MRGAIIHGILLVVMLVYGYRTWTRDKATKGNVGNVVLWDKSDAELVSIELVSERKSIKLERKGNERYWWGSDTTITKTPAPTPKPADAGSAAGSGSAGSGSAATGSAAGSGSAATAGSGSAGSAGSGSAGSGSAGSAVPPPEPVMVETRKTREFPLGDAGDTLVKNYLAARAIRDLGKPTDKAKKDYKLDDVKTTITVTFKDGTRTFLVGGKVFEGEDRYALDPQSGKAYVLSKSLVGELEGGESKLKLSEPRGFDIAKAASVTIEAGGKSKTAVRVTAAGEEGSKVKTWGDPVTKKPNQTITNFIDNTNNLKPTEYSTTIKVGATPAVVTLTYKDEHNAVLGTLTLYKHEKPAVLPEGVELDPANPPRGDLEYYIFTPRTRVAAIVRKDTGERTEQDIATVFSDNPVQSVDPKGNPFGKVNPDMLKGTGSAAAPNPHGAPPNGGPGLAPPTPPTGSAPPIGGPHPSAPAPTAPAPTKVAPPTPAPAAPKPAAPAAPKAAAPVAPKPAAPTPAPAAPAPTPAVPAPTPAAPAPTPAAPATP